MKLKTILYITLSALLLIGCQQKTISQSSLVKNSKVSSSQQQKVKQAFDNAEELQESHSKWFNRQEKLPLTIIATAYIDNQTRNTQEYKAYIKLIKKIEQNPKLLDKLSGQNISSKYSSVKFIDYDSSSKYKDKFNASYTKRYNDKSILTDILRPDREKPSQELLIRLNFEELQKGNLTIEGYKTVKESKLKRNSYYYTLRKSNYTKLSKKEKNQAIVNSLIATLQLSIPEYVSIDRSKLVKDGEILRFITPQEDGTYKGEVWKYSVNNELTKLNKSVREIRETYEILESDYGLTSNGSRSYYDTHNKNKYDPDYSVFSISDSAKFAIMTARYSKPMGIAIVDIDSAKKTMFPGSYGEKFHTIKITPDAKYAVSISYGKFKEPLKISSSSNYVSPSGYKFNYYNLKTNKKQVIQKYHGYNYKSSDTRSGSDFNIYISDNGKYALLRDKLGPLEYWDLEKKVKLNSIEIKGYFDYLEMTHDGKRLLYKEDDILKYIDLKTSKVLFKLLGKTATIDKDSQYALTIGGNKKSNKVLRYYSLKNSKLIKEIKLDSKDYLAYVKISDNNKYAIGTDLSKTIYIWSLKTGVLLKNIKLTDIHDSIKSISFSKDINEVVVVDTKNIIRKIRLVTNENKILQINKQIADIKKLSIYNEVQTKQVILTTQLIDTDRKVLSYIGSNKKEVEQALNYQSSDPFLVATFRGDYAKNVTLQILDKSLLIQNKAKIDINELYFSSYFDLEKSGYFKIYSSQNIKIKNKKITGFVYDTNFIAFDSLGKNITVGNMGGSKIKYINLKTNKVLNTLDVSYVNAVDISSNGELAAIAAYDTVVIWDLKAKEVIKTLKGHNSVIGAVTISPDGKYILSGEFHDKLIYWNAKTGKKIKTLLGNKSNWITSISFSPNGKYALVGGNLGDLRYWNLKKGKIIKSMKATQGLISPDGRYILSVYNNVLKYWDIKTNKTIYQFFNHNGAFAFSPDGKYAVSASKNEIRYLDLSSGEILVTLKGHTGFITDLKFSGNNIISVSTDGSIRYWDIGLAMINAKY